jgi:hypothetical protein
MVNADTRNTKGTLPIIQLPFVINKKLSTM